MLRSTRKTAAMGVVAVNADAAIVLRNEGMQHVAPLRKTGTIAKNPYHMTQNFSTVHGTVLSHLITSFATAVFLMILFSVNRGLEIAKTSGTVRRNMEFDNNERLLRRNIPELHQNKSVLFPFYDVVVVGSGPAGLTASLFAVRAGLNVLVIGSGTGLLSEAMSLDNFPSWYDMFSPPASGESDSLSTGGMSWIATTRVQTASAGVHFARPGLTVLKITKKPDNIFSLNISGTMLDTVTVILATGATGRKLNLPNEELLWGRSIHSCAICDGSSYQNKTVLVVGGGDAAVDAAILLSRHARAVILIHRRDTFRASNQRNLKALFTIAKTAIKTPFVVDEFLLKDKALKFSGVRIRNTLSNETETLICDGVFVMIGSTPNTHFLKDFVDLNDEGFIEMPPGVSDTSTRTSMEGVFAAGEVSDQQYKQAITAAAAGARAAIDAERWLRQQLPDVSSVQRSVSEYIPLESFSVDQLFSINQKALSSHVEMSEKQSANMECNDFASLDCLNAIVAQHPVVMFSKSTCPFCVQALEVLNMEGALKSAILVINIDGLNEGIIRSNLDSISGRRSVPNIFIGGMNIGGLVLLKRLQKIGELHDILDKANAIQRHEAGSDIECNDFRRTDCIEAIVHKYPVVVFSKSWCPYCKKALEALTMEGVTDLPLLLVVNLDELDAQTIQSNLARMTGRRTVPNVFIGGQTIGGGDETVQLQGTGALRTLLINARAIADS